MHQKELKYLFKLLTNNNSKKNCSKKFKDSNWNNVLYNSYYTKFKYKYFK